MARDLTNLVIDEVSFCIKGMNPHAKVALFKAVRETDTGPAAIAKATFQEALEGQLVASRVNEAFYSSFNGLWERNDAFRTALTDELAAGGDGSAASADYVASVKALVDTAVGAAREAGSTATDEDLQKIFTDAAEEWVAKFQPKEPTMKISTKAELLSAVAKFDPEKSPAGHIAIIQKAATDLGAEDALPAEGLLAKASPPADLVRKVAILEMPAEVRKHFDALDEAGQTAFLAKSADDRAEIVRKANEGDPVAYTCSDGTEIRKSAGAVAIAMAKRLDRLEGENKTLRSDMQKGNLAKRAADYPNVATAAAIDLLKGIDAAGGEETDSGKVLKAALVRANAIGGRLFKSIGSTEGGDGDGTGGTGDSEAKAEYNREVDKAAAELKIGRAEAMSKVRRDQPVLFAKAFPEAVEPEEAEA